MEAFRNILSYLEVNCIGWGREYSWSLPYVRQLFSKEMLNKGC